MGASQGKKMLGKTVKETAVLMVLLALLGLIAFGLVRELCVWVWKTIF
jgi:hypothetical protein